MNNRFLLFITLVCGTAHVAMAQKEANWWYFGYQAGMHFTNGSPTVVNNSNMVMYEGTAAVSNDNGNLLFYTDGRDVWTKNHTIMTNGTGLMGDFSTSQTLIIPNPGNPNIYYIFTADNDGGPNGIRYSVVDMTGSGGLGTVLSKNILLVTPVVEKITATKHQNHVDYWVVAHGWQNDLFYSFRVTAAGINPAPVVSAVGMVHQGAPSNAIGWARISADGSKLAIALRDVCVELFDFDRATGVVSNAIQLYQPTTFRYGVEFNLEGTILYVSTLSNQRIYQYDLTLGSQAAIQASQTLVAISTAPSLGALQIGPDGRIYVAEYPEPTISVISNPDVLGVGCGYVDHAINLNGSTSRLGLPNFINSIFYTPHIVSDLYCLGDSTEFILKNRRDVDSVHWDFDDPLSGSDNFSNLFEPKHLFSDTGTYIIEATIFCGPYQSTLHDTVVIIGPPVFNLGNDTMICVGDTLWLDASSEANSYLWQDGSTDSVFVATTAGTYWAAATNYCGTTRDTMSLQTMTPPIIDLGNDTVICIGDGVVFNAAYPDAIYIWSDGSTDSTLQVTGPGIYHVAVINICGTSFDTIMVSGITAPVVSLGADTSLCPGQTHLLDVAYPNATYLWHDGSMSPTYTVTGPGTYWAAVSNECGTESDTIVIQQLVMPSVDLGNDTTICQGDAILLDASFPQAAYQWHDGTTQPLKTISLPGTYWVDVINSCGTVRDSFILQNITPPIVNLGQDTSLCTGDSLILSVAYPNASYLWYDGSGGATHVATPPGVYWVDVTNVCGTVSDTIIIGELLAPNISLGNDTTICEGGTVTLDATYPLSTYQWSTGATSAVITATAAGSYEVAVTNGCGTVSDSISITVIPLPWVSLGNDTMICEGTTATFTATSNMSAFLWHDGSTQPSFTTGTSGVYYVTVSNQCGQAGDTVALGIMPAPTVDLGPDHIVCVGQAVTLQAIGSSITTYTWDDGSGLSTRTVYEPGVYTVTVANSCGTDMDAVQIDHRVLPVVDLGGDMVLCWGESYLLSVSDIGQTFLWNDGSEGSAYIVTQPGLYSVTVTDDLGCSGFDDVYVRYECDAVIEVPTAFCPSCNPPNDVFRVFGHTLDQFEVRVYNRWGEKVFASTDSGFEWDGTYGGAWVPIGAYAYVIRYRDFDGMEKQLQGNVTLLR